MSAIPKSRAKTALGLLSSIRRIIVDEPKRYAQEELLLIRDESLNRNWPAWPRCGTIGCVAGWTVVLKTENASGHSAVLDPAQKILGLSDKQAEELFNGGAIARLQKGKRAKVGTKAYARLGARHIGAFMKKYRAQLKATPV